MVTDSGLWIKDEIKNNVIIKSLSLGKLFV